MNAHAEELSTVGLMVFGMNTSPMSSRPLEPSGPRPAAFWLQRLIQQHPHLRFLQLPPPAKQLELFSSPPERRP